MKKIYFAFLFILCGALSLRGASVERVFITTDKDVYVAGDRLRFSAFCLDASTLRLSETSAVAYMELHSATSVALTCKIALVGGRGAGEISLPQTLPTGNYKIVVYTALAAAEQGYDFDNPWSRTISVFNTISPERVPDGVQIVEPSQYTAAVPAPSDCSCGDVRIALQGEASRGGILPVHIDAGGEATLCVSVFHDDGIIAPQNQSLSSFCSCVSALDAASVRYAEGTVPEYEGEIIRGNVRGANAQDISLLRDRNVFIAVPSDKSDIYASAVAPDGSLCFHTNNIYGKKDIVCEFDNAGLSESCRVHLESPFKATGINAPQKLCLSSALADRLNFRTLQMQIGSAFDSKALLSDLNVRENPLFTGECIRYAVDDYTKFPTIEEIVVEYLREVMVTRSKGRRDFKVLLATNTIFVTDDSENNTLILLDGVPVFNHEAMYQFDPSLLRYIDVYPYSYCVNPKVFDGVVNFITRKGDMGGMTFPDNVVITQWRGCALPKAYLCENAPADENYPDYRGTLYWHPILEVPQEGGCDFSCTLPCYGGNFRIVVQGLSADGKPLYNETRFTIK